MILVRTMDVFDEQTLELTLKASNEGIWDWERDTTEIFYSERILKSFGYESSPPPNIITSPEKLVHEDDLEYFKSNITQILNQTSDEHLKMDCRIVRPGGDIRWIRMRGIVTKERDVVTRITGSMIDISKRKFAEEMIEEEQHMLRLIIDNIPLQVYFKDMNSRYKLVNQRQVEWLGKKDESEVINKSSKEFFSSYSCEVHKKEEREIMLTGKSVINAIQKEQLQDREEVYVKKVKHPWYDSKNKLLGTYGISCDVTSLIKAKKKLEKLALNLQQQNKNHQEELLLAEEIQRAILPHNTPSWEQLCSAWQDRVQIETLYQPTSELAGDFYDIITLSENKLGFLMIDVTGHGVRSAMIISLIKGLMEHATHLAEEPAKYLEEINSELAIILQKASINLFASASYTLIDFDSNQATITNAGHSYPLLQFKPDSNQQPLHKTLSESNKELALGIQVHAKYTEHVFPLQEIQSVLLYTDGIYETPNNKNKKWDILSLTHVYREALSQTKNSTLKYISNAASEWSGRKHFNDDICLINLDINTSSC